MKDIEDKINRVLESFLVQQMVDLVKPYPVRFRLTIESKIENLLEADNLCR